MRRITVIFFVLLLSYPFFGTKAKPPSVCNQAPDFQCYSQSGFVRKKLENTGESGDAAMAKTCISLCHTRFHPDSQPIQYDYCLHDRVYACSLIAAEYLIHGNHCGINDGNEKRLWKARSNTTKTGFVDAVDEVCMKHDSCIGGKGYDCSCDTDAVNELLSLLRKDRNLNENTKEQGIMILNSLRLLLHARDPKWRIKSWVLGFLSEAPDAKKRFKSCENKSKVLEAGMTVSP